MNPTVKDVLGILLNPTVTFFIGILTVLMTRNNNAFSIARERLTLAYQPLFVEIEPFLYKKVCYDDIVPFLQKYHEIENKHALFINPTLRKNISMINESFFDIEMDFEEFKYDNWFNICDILSRDYDSLCRQCHIPVRSISYRIFKEQFRSRFLLLLGWLWIMLPLILSIICFIFAFVFPQLWFMPCISLGCLLLWKTTYHL